jgi:hypothetical protein
MKKGFLVLALAALSSGIALADGICLNVSGTLLLGQSLSGGAATCSIGSQLFTNFNLYANAGFPTGPGGAVPFSWSVTVTGQNLIFGTTNMAGTGEDVQITFQTSPGIRQIGLSTGPGESVTEIVCGVAFSLGSETCTSPLNTTPLTSFNGGPMVSSAVNASTTDFFLKDVSGGSQVTQTFVPEPVTMSLMGVGLLGLGILGRRKLRK